MKAKFFKGRYESKLEFPLGFRRGGGFQARNSSVRGELIFSGTTIPIWESSELQWGDDLLA